MKKKEELLQRLDNAKKRYEVKCQELNECSKFSTQQAIKIVNFESRTCINCKYFQDHCEIWYAAYNMGKEDSFYCSVFVSTDTKSH